MDFDYFMKLEEEGSKNLAILDIDGSYTNDRQFEKMENEGNAMRTLNTLKNKKIRKCDYAFTSMVQDEDEDSETFVREVRQTFFNFLKTFLGEIPKCFKAEESLKKLDDQQKVFHKYFDKD